MLTLLNNEIKDVCREINDVHESIENRTYTYASVCDFVECIGAIYEKARTREFKESIDRVLEKERLATGHA